MFFEKLLLLLLNDVVSHKQEVIMLIMLIYVHNNVHNVPYNIHLLKGSSLVLDYKVMEMYGWCKIQQLYPCKELLS